MEYTKDDFISTICLKNQLANASVEMLLQEMKNIEQYGWFIDTVNIMMDMDSGFLLLNPPHIEKIEEIIYKKRFEIKDPDYIKITNEIIVNINEIKTRSTTQTNLIKNAYLDYQEDSRRLSFEDDQGLVIAISHDALVCLALEEGDLSPIDNPDLFLSTTNYLLASIPEIYEDEKALSLTLQKVEDLSHKRGFRNRVIREYAKETMKNFQLIKK